jgi:hypothetical protein
MSARRYLVRQGDWLLCKPNGRQDARTMDEREVEYAIYNFRFAPKTTEVLRCRN